MLRTFKRPVIPLLALALLGAPASAVPPAESPVLASFENMVANMGYTPEESSDKTNFSVLLDGADYSYNAVFSVSSDGGMVVIYAQVATYSGEQLTRLNCVKLLEASDPDDFYFSMEKTGTNETLYANGTLPLKGLTPQILRPYLEGWVGDIDASQSVWDTTLWRASPDRSL